jgi:hypothetical protein
MAHTIVTIRVTEEQLMAIEHFFIHCDWELKIQKEEADNNAIEELFTEQVVENVAIIPEAVVGSSVSDSGQQDNPNNPSFDNTSNDDDEDFCREGNNLVRKTKYKLFWKMLDNRGV